MYNITFSIPLALTSTVYYENDITVVRICFMLVRVEYMISAIRPR